MTTDAQTESHGGEPTGEAESDTDRAVAPVTGVGQSPPLPAKRTADTQAQGDAADHHGGQQLNNNNHNHNMQQKDTPTRLVPPEPQPRPQQTPPAHLQEGDGQTAIRQDQGQGAGKDGQRASVILLPLSRDVLLKPHGETGEETRLAIPRFLEHIDNIKSVIHAIKMEKFPEEIAREVAELQRKKEKRPVTNIDEYILLPSEVEAAKNDTRTLYGLLVEDPQLSLRRDFLWGYTLLHWAAKANSLRSVRLLLDAGANPRAQSHGGLTPLHTAAMSDKTDQIVQLLMEKGADVDIKTNSGLKARDVARGEKRFLLQSRLDCWDFKVVKQVIPNLKSMYM